MWILIPLIAALVPMVITPGLLFHFDITPKVVVFLLGVSVLAFFWRENARALTGLVGVREGRWFSALLGLQLIWIAVCTITSADRNLSLYGSEWRRFGLAENIALILYAGCVAAWVRVGENLLLLLRASVVSGGLIAAYGVLQYFGWDPLIPAAAYQAGEGPFTIVRPPGTLGHADYLAAFLVFAFFCSLALARQEPPGWMRNVSYGTASLTAVAVLLSGTRAGLAGLAAGGLLLVVRKREPIRKQRIAGAVVVLVLLAAFMFSPPGAKLRARVHWSADDPFGGARLLLWRDTLRMATARPWTGYGPELFVLEFPQFQSLALARAYPDFYHESPHNVFLDALAAQGVLGALLTLAIWIPAGVSGVRAWRSGASVAAPLMAGGLAFFVSQQFSVWILPTALCSYLLQAMLVGIAPATTESEPRGARYFAVAWMALLVLSATPLVALALRFAAADRALATAQAAIADRDVGAARDAYEAHKRWSPPGTTSDLFYSRALAALAGGTTEPAMRFDVSTEALQAGARATRYSEQRANAWYSLAGLFASRDDRYSVERCLRNAIAWAPNWFKPHWTLAQFLQLSGRRPEALQEATAAMDRGGYSHAEVTATWRELKRASEAR